VQSVEEEQARRHFVTSAGIEDRGAGLARRAQMAEDALQSSSMQVEDSLHNLTSMRLRRGIGPALHFLQQSIETLQARLKLLGIE